MDIKAAAALIESEYRARAARAEEAYRRALATHPALYEAEKAARAAVLDGKPDDEAARLRARVTEVMREEGLDPSEFVASGSLFFAEIFFDAAFGCDAGVVGSGEPADFIAFHSVPARENILKRIVENMPHGQDAGHVRRGDHDGIRFFIGIGLAVEKAVVFPVGIPFFLDGRGFVCFRHL